jgi:hypothetical protein
MYPNEMIAPDGRYLRAADTSARKGVPKRLVILSSAAAFGAPASVAAWHAKPT